MKKLGNLLGFLGILLVIYTLVGRFVGGPTIGFGMTTIEAKAGLLMANALMLIAVLMRSSN
ncbi:MAG: hypothetical protein ABH843_03165 [Candidatus Omnitrophota bacterium]